MAPLRDSLERLAAGDDRLRARAAAGERVVALAVACLFAAMALARFATFHNETFDLAFYARTVWGLGRGDLYNPLVGASFLGLHLSWALLPLAALGRVVPVAPLLLVVQAVAVALAAVPIARIARRRLAFAGAPFLAMAVYFLQPSIGWLATYEFHPSALALPGLTLALDAFDDDRPRLGALALAYAVGCREDVALVAALMGLSLALERPTRRLGLALFAACTAYFALYLLVVAPRFLPREGSLQLHFGHLGASPAAIVSALLAHPLGVARALATPVRLRYLPRLLVGVGALPLAAPRWLLPALAPVAINLLSQFPTATQVHSHYTALAAPFLVVSALHGLARLGRLQGRATPRAQWAAALLVVLGARHLQRRAGTLPLLGGRFDLAALRAHPAQRDLERLVAEIPPEASVTAPDFVLSHLAERPQLYRLSAAPHRSDLRVLSTAYRARFEGTEALFRNTEERAVRNALNQRRYGVVSVHGPFVLQRDGHDARAFARGRYVETLADPEMRPVRVEIGASLTVVGWALARGADRDHARLRLWLTATRAWPFDLGMQLGWGPMHPHLDRDDPAQIWSFLPFDGVFSPSNVRVGEVVRVEVALPATQETLLRDGVVFGARRIDSSRLDPASAHWTLLPGSRDPAHGAGSVDRPCEQRCLALRSVAGCEPSDPQPVAPEERVGCRVRRGLAFEECLDVCRLPLGVAPERRAACHERCREQTFSTPLCRMNAPPACRTWQARALRRCLVSPECDVPDDLLREQR